MPKHRLLLRAGRMSNITDNIDKSPTSPFSDGRCPRITPTMTVLSGLKNALDGLDLFSQDVDVATDIVLVESTANSMKVAWNPSSPGMKSNEVYDLQWKLEGSDVWNSLPNPLNVPKIRFDHLLPEAHISFRVRRKASGSAGWSGFSPTATFKTGSDQFEEGRQSFGTRNAWEV